MEEAAVAPVDAFVDGTGDSVSCGMLFDGFAVGAADSLFEADADGTGASVGLVVEAEELGLAIGLSLFSPDGLGEAEVPLDSVEEVETDGIWDGRDGTTGVNLGDGEGFVVVLTGFFFGVGFFVGSVDPKAFELTMDIAETRLEAINDRRVTALALDWEEPQPPSFPH